MKLKGIDMTNFLNSEYSIEPEIKNGVSTGRFLVLDSNKKVVYEATTLGEAEDWILQSPVERAEKAREFLATLQENPKPADQ